MTNDLRALFPFFKANPGLVYLDSAATALKPDTVISALNAYNISQSVNIHRGVYRLSQQATDTVEAVRARTTAYLSDSDDATALFVKGTTEGFNLLAHSLTSPASRLESSYSSYKSKKPPAILLSESEHHANIIPWQVAAKRAGFKLLYIPVNADGAMNTKAAEISALFDTHAIRIVSLSLQSNVTGIIHDLTPVRELAAKHGSIFIIDAAQAAVHAIEMIKALKPNFVVFSAHKLFGATGVGAIVGSKAEFDNCDVYQTGGGMIALVEKESSTYLEAPARFEAGTQPIGEIYALGAALDFVTTQAATIRAADENLRNYADEKLERLGIRVFGLSAGSMRSPIYSFEIPGVHAHDTGTLLDEQDICIRAGHHCCQPLMRAFGVSATARASFAVYNTQDDVDRLISGIEYVKKIFRK
jgi:cysteine desulfurase / selenocysteine lyase